MGLSFSPVLLSLLAVGVTLTYGAYRRATLNLDAIPVLGYTNPLLSYIDAFRHTDDIYSVIDKGVHKFKGAPFRIALMRRWLVIMTRPECLEDLRKATDEEVDAEGAGEELLHTDVIFGADVSHNTYHVPIIRNPLTRLLGSRFDDMFDEMDRAFVEFLPPTAEWTQVHAPTLLPKIVSRISNRFLLSSEDLCRDEELQSLGIEFGINSMGTANAISAYPSLLKPFVAWYYSSYGAVLNRTAQILSPLINDRISQEKEAQVENPDKPKDLVDLLLAATLSTDSASRIREIAGRFLAVNFGGIHTVAAAFTQALYYLAANPSYLIPLREEVLEVVSAQGWSRDSMKKMVKADSFLRESSRVNVPTLALSRRMAKDFTFSDGTVLPKGTFMAVAVSKEQRSDFDGFKYSKSREDALEPGITKPLFSTPAPDYLTFGYGRHACPGRFFAAQELKMMLAYVVTRYDIKFDMEEGTRPENELFGLFVMPNSKAKVLFKKRSDLDSSDL